MTQTEYDRLTSTVTDFEAVRTEIERFRQHEAERLKSYYVSRL